MAAKLSLPLITAGGLLAAMLLKFVGTFVVDGVPGGLVISVCELTAAVAVAIVAIADACEPGGGACFCADGMPFT